MQDDSITTGTGGSGRRRIGAAAGLLAAGALAGGVLAGTLSASAADSSTGSTSGGYSATAPQQSGPQGAPQGAPQGGDRHGSTPVRGDEQALSAADAAKVKAAALEAVAGGTVYRVETDAGDAAYEAHMTKADGTEVTVKLDESFTVTAVENGMGQGDPDLGGAAGAPSGSQSGVTPGGSSADNGSSSESGTSSTTVGSAGSVSAV